MEHARWTMPEQPAEGPTSYAAASAGGGGASPGKVVVLAAVPNGQAPARHPNADAAAGKWPGVLERVRGAAQYIRQVEDRAQDYEARVHELLEQVRADMRDADAKVRAAEQRTREIQVQADALIGAAESRARAAEERAVSAEEWLRRISEAIESEFVVEPAPQRRTGTLDA
ncbi:hypothetical protein [Methylobacterium sp. J-070]|uniref:hypothetical protein n=1 Tax=Methylobacterium sp. J-070 TaxID=2836650 RepID=UPI001FBAEC43|nr:hypothetical protein [Methylobacterium sp. J-070]MCJ2048810.1 hypothetical protein [Methylobacterium sp. J-070]